MSYWEVDSLVLCSHLNYPALLFECVAQSGVRTVMVGVVVGVVIVIVAHQHLIEITAAVLWDTTVIFAGALQKVCRVSSLPILQKKFRTHVILNFLPSLPCPYWYKWCKDCH